MNILEGLNPEQEKAVKHFRGPLLILAGAGSGKTRVLTHRIAFLISEYGVNPWNILALTFTNKAAGEMRERVRTVVGDRASDIWVSTFHSACVRILRRQIEALGYTRSFTIYDADDQKTLMRDIIKYLELDPKKYKERAFLAEISSAKDSLISPEEYELTAQGDYMKEIYAKAYKEYEKRLKDANALDFDNLICKTIQIFKENPDILEFYRERFQFIMVDEYQDTNTAQFELIRLMAVCKNENGGLEHNLCVVGDDDQSIYKFRGANIYNILNFEKVYPDCKTIRLEENYRSTQNILNAANAVIKNNVERKEKALWTEKQEGDTLYFSTFQNEYEEASAISDAIKMAVTTGQANYNDFAILYRTNAQSRVFEEKLVTANIPYRIVGAINFYQRREIKDLLAYLRLIENELDDISVRRIINVPKRGIGLTTIDRISTYAIERETSFYSALLDYEYIDGISRSAGKIGSFVSLIESFKMHNASPDYSLEDLIREIIEETGYVRLLEDEGTEEAEGRIENIEELVSKVVSYEENLGEEATLGGFLEEISLVADIDNVDEDNNLVLLMTLHSAKGLEFPYVYMVGMEEGIFPGYGAMISDDPTEIEEERRLCYVGITRAKEKLSMSHAISRFRNGEQQYNALSRFVHEIPRYLIQMSTDATNRQSRLTNQISSRQSSNSSQNFSSQIGSKGNQSSGRQKTKSGKGLFAGNPYISKGFANPDSGKTSGGSAPDYGVGDKVLHTQFGEGIVKLMSEKSGDFEVTVDFDSGTTRKMRASFAKMKKIS